jgi:hypothetical protein
MLWENDANPAPPAVVYLSIAVDNSTFATINLTVSTVGSSPYDHYITTADLTADLNTGLSSRNGHAVDNTTYVSVESDRIGQDGKISIKIEDPDESSPPVNVAALVFQGYPEFNATPFWDSGSPGLATAEMDYYGSWATAASIEEIIETETPAEVEGALTKLGKGDYGEIFSTTEFRVMSIDSITGDVEVVNGSTSLYSPTVNFENLGAKAGQLVKYNNGAGAYTHDTIASVTTNTITLTTEATFTSSSGNAAVYPDTTQISTGDVLVLDGPALTGNYKITSYSTTNPDELTIESVFPVSSGTCSFALKREYLTIKSNTAGVTSSVEVQSVANDAAAVLGLTGASERGTVSGFSSEEDFVSSRIQPGDSLERGGSYTVSAVGDSLTLSTEIPNDAVGPFSITNPDYQKYSIFRTALQNWQTANETLSQTIDRAVNPVVNDTPPFGVISKLQTQCDTYIAAYEELTAAIEANTCRQIVAVDDLIKLLDASGMKRAKDKLNEADFATFFTMSEEDTTYHGYFTKAARQTISEYGNLNKYQDLVRTELRHFVYPLDFQEVEDI